ncbi:MHO_4530 family protein [Mycoplasmopsis opalescens]|uniref:MHO_4530 family protein n=1 Tax=Mycoplasmopsis opalescens TaxID=114886 RepID=UPI0004A7202C|nr:hypothetical protein [Mycoplasmopsis opalescens]
MNSHFQIFITSSIRLNSNIRPSNLSITPETVTKNTGHLLILIAIIFAFIFLVALPLIIYFIKQSINKINIDGFLSFKIDMENKVVIRNSSKALSDSSMLDISQEGVKTNKYIELDYFLSFFDTKSRHQLENYLFGGEKQKKVYFEGHFAKNKIKPYLKKISMKLYKFTARSSMVSFRLYFQPETNSFVCNIFWGYKHDLANKKVYTVVNNPAELVKKASYPYYLVYAFNHKIDYYVKKMNYFDYFNIINLMGITKGENHIIIYKFMGSIQILVGFDSITECTKSLKRHIRYKGKASNNTKYLKYFDQYVLLQVVRPTEENQVLNNNYKIRYLLDNLKNTNDINKFGYWAFGDIAHEKPFANYYSKLLEYNQQHQLQNYIKNVVHVKTYESQENTNIDYLTAEVVGMEKEDICFFDNVNWNRHYFNSQINNFLLLSRNKEKINIIDTTENDLLHNITTYKEKNLIFLIRERNISEPFNIDNILKLSKKLSRNQKIALYIEEIFPQTKVLALKNNVDTFVISEKLTNSVPIDIIKLTYLFDFIESISSAGNIKLIYENPPKNLPKEIKKKLKIKYAYWNK